jgi:hypothetical protein
MTQAHDVRPSLADNGQGHQWANVDLGPPLPMAVYTCSETWNEARIGALALYCSDGRWGEAFDEFCHKRLLIPRYDRLAVAGGPAWLVSRDKGGDLYRACRAQLDFLVRVHELERIVLITHYGCAFYRELLNQPADDCLPTQTDDLRAGRTTLLDWYPDIQVETYLAMRTGRSLSFHEVVF